MKSGLIRGRAGIFPHTLILPILCSWKCEFRFCYERFCFLLIRSLRIRWTLEMTWVIKISQRSLTQRMSSFASMIR